MFFGVVCMIYNYIIFQKKLSQAQQRGREDTRKPEIKAARASIRKIELEERRLDRQMQKRTEDEDDDFTNAHMPPWPRHETRKPEIKAARASKEEERDRQMQKRTEDDDFTTNAHMPPWQRHEIDEMFLTRCGILNMMGASEKTAEEVVSEYEEKKKRWFRQSHGCWQPDCEPVEPGATESKKVSPGPQEPMPTRPPPTMSFRYNELNLKVTPAVKATPPAMKVTPAVKAVAPPVKALPVKALPVKALAVKAPPSAARAAPPVKAPPADIVGVPPVKMARPAAKAPPVKALPVKAPPAANALPVKAPPAANALPVIYE